MTTYVKTPLFGGAIAADLPSDFVDVSALREVPDNQEVYLSKTELISIIIDITERVAPPSHSCATDEEALQYHFNDIVANEYGGTETSPGETTHLWSSNHVVLSNLPNNKALTLFASQIAPKQDPNVAQKLQPVFTAIILTLVRLEKQKTDILMTVNVPHVPGEYNKDEVDLPTGNLGPLITKAMEYRDRLFQSFTIEDWDLFVNE